MAINFFKSEKKFRKGGMHFTAGFFWQVIFSTGLIILAVSFALGFILFWSVNKEFVSSEAGKEQISKERLDKALEYFKDKEKKMELVLKATAPSIDPSQ